MAVDTNPLSTAETLAIDSAETIALWKMPGGAIERAYESNIHISPDEAFDYRIDLGMLDANTDEPSQESDITWFNGVISKSKSDASAEHHSVSDSVMYARMVVTTAASAGSQAKIGHAVGRK